MSVFNSRQELHAHLNGSVSSQTIEKLIRRKPHLNIQHSMTAIGKGQRRTLEEYVQLSVCNYSASGSELNRCHRWVLCDYIRPDDIEEWISRYCLLTGKQINCIRTDNVPINTQAKLWKRATSFSGKPVNNGARISAGVFRSSRLSISWWTQRRISWWWGLVLSVC